MSANDRSSDNEESHVSQLLQTLLDPGDGRRKTSDMQSLGQGDPDLTTGSATDSSPSGASVSLHFHGLGQTQTQYLDEEMYTNEGSQKENIGTGTEERSKMSATIALNTNTGSSSFNVTKPRSVGVKGVSFQSPLKKRVPPPPTNHSAQRQPPRSATLPKSAPTSRKNIASPLSSQDSFGVLDQDPSQQFLATSKQFNVPLSDLPKVVVPPAAAQSARSSSMYSSKYHPRRDRRSPSPFEGTVLVESTPSASGGSQSQHTQSYPEAQVSEVVPDRPNSQIDNTEIDHPMDNTDDPTHLPIEEAFSDAPSSFYADHNDESFASTALAPTQPSTQVEDNDSMDIEPHPFDAVIDKHNNYTGNTASTTTSNPRSLLSMVDPKKRYRYQYLIQAQNQSSPGVNSPLSPSEDKPPSTTRRSPTPHLPSNPQVHSEMLVETQPSLDEELRKPVQRRIPGHSQSPNRTSFLAYPHGESSGHAVKSQETTVIPASEYPQGGLFAGDISKPASSGRVPINTLHSRNIVEDSSTQLLEVANSFPNGDDDDDASLSEVVSSKGRKHSARGSKGKGKGKALYDPAEDELIEKSGFCQGKRSVAGRSNQQATSVPAIPPLDVPAPTSNARTTRASAALAMYRPPGTVPSWENGVVPSSIPNENAGRGVKSRTNTAASKRGKGHSTGACARTKRTPVTRAKRIPRRAESNAESSSLSASDDELLIQKGGSEDDLNESEDGVDMDSNFAGATSKKRKRKDTSKKSTMTKPQSSKKVKRVASLTPSTRQTKRLKSVRSGSRMSDVAATRVFALWKRDSCYYSGTVDADIGGGMYEVYFDDKSGARVHIDQMRLLDLRVNDDVMIPDIMRGFKVTAVDNLASSGLVSVRLDEGIKEMELASLKIAAKTISVAWQDRTLSRHSIVPTIKPEPIQASPAPSLASVPSRRTGRGHVFEKTAFVVSVSSNESNWERERENLLSRIKNNGGVIVNDWSDVLNMEGAYSKHNNRWIIEKGEAQWVGGEGIARIFLVADQPSYKPKFLLALALGVPCLKVEWLYHTVAAGEEREWLAYMLGQGFSEDLSTQISQQIDVNWGTSVHHLTDIMENKVPCKLFSGKSILCVGDLVPRAKNKKFPLADGKAQEAHNAITRIILAMGADRVEAVTDADYASAPLHEFDFVVIKKVEHYSLESGMVPNKTVHWNWVKECLVASRLLPQPEWGVESQEA